MNRLTINLPVELHKALKTAAARRGETIGGLVRESLEAYGIKPERTVQQIVAAAREHSRLPVSQAEKVAVEETRKVRQQ